MNSYAERVLTELRQKYPEETEFLQASEEILASLSGFLDRNPGYERQGILERFVEPERVILFRVPWVDDEGRVRVNRGFRVQFSSAIGPYKGGLRLHPSVNLSIIKFLGLEQTLKNALTGLPIGGGKGGSDFDPKGRSDREVMAFCQSFMTELYRHIGPDTDAPAGDMGAGPREVGFLYGQYKRITGRAEGAITGKPVSCGGSLCRREATGYGLCYLVEEMLGARGCSFRDRRVTVSGSGCVAVYAAEKAKALGAKVVAMSDSGGFVVDENGVDLDQVKRIKQDRRGSLRDYRGPNAAYEQDSSGIWTVPCDIALPCATQNELGLNAARTLADNGCLAVGEGANMPVTSEAVRLLLRRGVLFAPGKAANAGGVAVSALEMSQNSQRLPWTFKQVDSRLKGIMRAIFAKIRQAALESGEPENYVVGANVAGFGAVSQAMLAQGVV